MYSRKLLICFVSVFTIISLFVIGCNSKSKLLTEGELCHTYLDSLSKQFPEVKFTIIDDRTISSTYQGKEMRSYIDNAYNDYKLTPESLKAILHRYVSSAGDLFNPNFGKHLLLENIVPIIKPVGYLEESQKQAGAMGAKKDIGNVYDKYNDQLIVAYAEDSKNNIRYLLPEELKTLGISRDSLLSVAIDNLHRIMKPRVIIHGDSGVYRITGGGDYEASLILLPTLWTNENMPVQGSFVIAIPNRDILLITGSEDKADIEKIKKFAKKSFSSGNYSISESLYKWNGRKFEMYE
jgi:uncharacterized protein YtpQ (UPF0354 family)